MFHLPGRHRGTDSIIKSINLKRGYTLVYRHTDTANLVLIEKGGISNEAGEEQADPKMPLDVLGSLYADFDNTFALITHLPDSPLKITIYDKKTGGMLVYGKTPFYLDTIRGLMMYEGAYGKAGMLVLYDSKNGKTELYLAPADTPCFCCCCWKATEVSDKEIKIEYINMNYEKAVKVYERK
ncbi:MAG: hypothetical protein HKL88_08870 [Bacteroidia bacterium]|nr:hypothetical protein [Bacteroidia bacterium]